MKPEYDVIVIGGGAAGMISSVKAAERKRRVLLLEQSSRTGRKILASGNGRCNLMNTGEFRYYGDTAFADRVFQYCTRKDLISFLNDYGLILTEETEGRVYPVTYQSASVHSVLNNAMEINGVHTVMNSRVQSAGCHDGYFRIQTSEGKEYSSGKLIVACGGAAQPKLGGSYDGYGLMQAFGHRMIQARPSLVPLLADRISISGLAGIRIRCGVSLVRNREIIHQEDGEVLFTEYGISGICIMQCARFAEIPGSCVYMDFLKYAFPDVHSAREELLRRKRVFHTCSPLWLLNGILPEKLSFAVLKQAGLKMHGESVSEIDEHMIGHIVDTAKAYCVRITGSRGFEHAQVTAGGTDCSEIEASTMESRMVQGLHAAGEVLNVDGDCGGFNMMFAFATGLIAGNAV